MTDATDTHRERALEALANAGEPLTTAQMIARGSCWRAVRELVSEGTITNVGSTPTARPLYSPVCGRCSATNPVSPCPVPGCSW